VAEERVRAALAQELGHRSGGGAEAGLGVTLSPTLLLDVVVGGFTTGGIYALVALGLNLQYGLMRVLNVAHGEFLMLGAYVTFSLHTGWGVNPLLTLLITGPTAFAVGLVLHRLLYAPLLAGEAAESLESRSLLLSFGLMFVLQNAALLIWSADLKGYSYLAIPLRWLGTVFPANRVLAAAIALALGVAFYLYLRYSLTGKAVRALMQEPEGAQLMGIQTARIHGLCFGAGIAMSAVTGSLVSMLFELTPFMGLPYTVTALVVVILGGLGNMLGCLLAGLLLGLVETAGVYLASSDIRLISSYAVLSLILILRPSGLFGR
jgi:branched-chain amino acid transport system permease protein